MAEGPADITRRAQVHAVEPHNRISIGDHIINAESIISEGGHFHVGREVLQEKGFGVPSVHSGEGRGQVSPPEGRHRGKLNIEAFGA